MRRVIFFLLLGLLPVLAFSQNSKKVKALQKQKAELQSTIQKSKAELTKTKQQVKVGQQNIQYMQLLFHY